MGLGMILFLGKLNRALSLSQSSVANPPAEHRERERERERAQRTGRTKDEKLAERGREGIGMERMHTAHTQSLN